MGSASSESTSSGLSIQVAIKSPRLEVNLRPYFREKLPVGQLFKLRFVSGVDHGTPKRLQHATTAKFSKYRSQDVGTRKCGPLAHIKSTLGSL